MAFDEEMASNGFVIDVVEDDPLAALNVVIPEDEEEPETSSNKDVKEDMPEDDVEEETPLVPEPATMPPPLPSALGNNNRAFLRHKEANSNVALGIAEVLNSEEDP